MDKLVEIVRSFFTEFVISIDDLKNPTPIFVRDFFVRALIELNVDIENVRKVQIHQNDVEDIDILPELNLLTAIRCAFPFISIGLFDLLNPNSKKIVKTIGTVMNFLQFADCRMSKLITESEEFIREKAMLDELSKEKEEMTQKLNNMILEKDSTLDKKLKLESEIKEKKAEEQRLEEEFLLYSSQNEELNREFKKKEEHLIALTSQVSNLKEEVESLRAEIIDNPKMLQEEFESKEQEKMKLEQEKDELWKQVLEKQQTKATLQTFYEKFKETLGKALPTLMQMIQRTCEANDEIQCIKKDTKTLETELETYADKCQESQLKIDSLQEQMRTMELNHKEKLSELENKMSEERSELQALLDKKATLEKNLLHIKNELKRYDDLIIQYQKEADEVTMKFHEIGAYYTNYEERDKAVMDTIDRIKVGLKLVGKQS